MDLMKRQNDNYSSLLDRFFNDEWRFGSQSVFNNDWVPATNIRELENGYEIEMSVPGMRKEDLSIDFANGKLTVTGKHSSETENNNENYRRREFGYASFEKSFRLPEGITEKEISAKHENGILFIRLEKKNSWFKKSGSIRIK